MITIHQYNYGNNLDPQNELSFILDESVRYKTSPWSAGQSTSNSSWSQASAPVYQVGNSAQAFQTDNNFLFEGFPADPHCQQPPSSSHYQQNALLNNMPVTQGRTNFTPTAYLDAYVSSIHPSNAESHSGTSSGSTASPSVASSSVLTNFGSGGSDSTTLQGNFDPTSMKPTAPDWMPLTEGVSGGVYLQNISSSHVSIRRNLKYIFA